MSILLLTILGSLLLAGFFIAAFCFERLSRKGRSRWQRDSLLPLEGGKITNKDTETNDLPSL